MKRRRNRYKTNNKFNIKSIPMLAVVLVLLLSVGFSTEKVQLKLSNIGGTVTLEKSNSEVMISNFSVSSSTSNGVSTSSNYKDNVLSGGVTLPNADSKVTYKVEVTNVGSEQYGILNIVNENEYLDYELTDYTLKDPICDTNGECTLGVTKEFYITIKYKDGVYQNKYDEEYVIDKSACIVAAGENGLDPSVCDKPVSEFITYIDSALSLGNVEATKAEMINMGLLILSPKYYIDYDTCVTTGESMGISTDESKELCSTSYSNLIYQIQTKFALDSYNTSATQLESMGVISKYPTNFEFNLGLDFRTLYTITYSGITNNGYPTTIMNGENLEIAFVDDVPEVVSLSSDTGYLIENGDFSYSSGVLKIFNANSNIIVSLGSCYTYTKDQGIVRYSCSNKDIEIPYSLPVSEIVSMEFNMEKCMAQGATEENCATISKEYDSYPVEIQLSLPIELLFDVEYQLSDEIAVVTKIGPRAFYNKGITSLKFLDNNEIVEIGSGAFYKNNLTGKLTLPSNLINIGGGAFWYNQLNGELVIPKTVKNIYSQAFAGDCEETTENNCFTKLVFEEGSKLETIGDMAFVQNQLTELSLPDSVTSIGDWAFQNNLIEGELILPSNLVEVGQYAFDSNKFSGELVIPKSVKTIGSYAFRGGTEENNFTKLTFEEDSALTEIEVGVFSYNQITGSIELPPNITSIGRNAFYDNIITNVLIIPKSVETIGDNAFRDNQISTLIFEDGSVLTSVGAQVFTGNLIECELNFPVGVTTIGRYAFYGQKISGELSLPNIVSIGEYSFSGHNLDTINLGNKITEIGEDAFRPYGWWAGTINIDMTQEEFEALNITTQWYSSHPKINYKQS